MLLQFAKPGAGVQGVIQTILGKSSTISTMSRHPSFLILKATTLSDAWLPTIRKLPELSKLKCLGNAPRLGCMATLSRLPSSGSTWKTARELWPLFATYRNFPFGWRRISATVDFTDRSPGTVEIVWIVCNREGTAVLVLVVMVLVVEIVVSPTCSPFMTLGTAFLLYVSTVTVLSSSPHTYTTSSLLWNSICLGPNPSLSCSNPNLVMDPCLIENSCIWSLPRSGIRYSFPSL